MQSQAVRGKSLAHIGARRCGHRLNGAVAQLGVHSVQLLLQLLLFLAVRQVAGNGLVGATGIVNGRTLKVL